MELNRVPVPGHRPHGPPGRRDSMKTPAAMVPLMSSGYTSFWVAALIGFVVMVVLSPLPLVGPIVGGFIAGLLAGGGAWNGLKAGFTAGIFGAIVLGIIMVVGGTLLLGIVGFLGGTVGALTLIILAVYTGVLGLIGGAIGGIIAGT